MFPVTLSAQHSNIPLPPTGVFDWHYLQCVLLRFATDQYRQLLNIAFFVYAFKTIDDESDDEFEDDINDEPPYPSYRFDRLMALQWEKHREQEQFKEVAQWASKVASEAEWGFICNQSKRKNTCMYTLATFRFFFSRLSFAVLIYSLLNGTVLFPTTID